MLNVPLLHVFWTDPSAQFSGGVGRSPTFTLPTTTHLKNMRSFLRHPVYIPTWVGKRIDPSIFMYLIIDKQYNLTTGSLGNCRGIL
jgi:hypothetical protein